MLKYCCGQLGVGEVPDLILEPDLGYTLSLVAFTKILAFFKKNNFTTLILPENQTWNFTVVSYVAEIIVVM